MTLYLSSTGVPRLERMLELRAPGTRTCLLTTASRHLPDRDHIVAAALGALAEQGLDVEVLDPDEDNPRPLEALGSPRDYHVVAVSGGDPFYLLRRVHEMGFDDFARQAVQAGALYVGISAGGMIAGPSLEPATMVSPFQPEEGQDLAGLHLTDTVILPHHDHPGRAERHEAIIQHYEGYYAIEPLSDGEALVISSDGVVRLSEPVTAAD